MHAMLKTGASSVGVSSGTHGPFMQVKVLGD